MASRIEEIDGEVQEVVIEKPASEQQIIKVEKVLGFKKTLLDFSSELSLRWFLPDDFELHRINPKRAIKVGAAN
jgi:hypothetical protein